MKSLYHCRYRFYKHALTPQKILAISDVHFAGEINDHHRRAANFARQSKPDLIVVTGDIINNVYAVKNQEQQQNLRDWFLELGKIAPVCACLGNHDSYEYLKDRPVRVGRRKYNYAARNNSPLIECLANLDNVHLLVNEVYEDKNNYVFGLSVPPDYYDSPMHPGVEKKELLIEELKRYKKLLQNLPNGKAKIFLVHSPIYLTDLEVRKYLNEFDFILAGHMHNGVVPPILHELWRGHRGITTADKHLFANQNTRLGLYDDKFIELGAVVTISRKMKTFGVFNTFFPTNVATIEISHAQPDGHKPSVRRRYKKLRS